MKRTTYVLGALLIAAGVLAYLSWSRAPAAVGPGKTVLLDVSPDEATAVRFLARGEGESGPTGVTLAAREDALGRWWEVTLPDGRRVTGGDPAERVLAQLLPLTALRVLDDVAPEARAELGVDEGEGEATLTVTSGDAEHRYRVGGESYGSPRRYLRAEGEARVALLDAAPFRALAAPADALVERDPLGVRRVDLERATVRVSDLEVVLARQGDDPRTAYWSMVGQEDRPSEAFAGWLDGLYRLRVVAYVPEGEVPGDLEDVVTVTLGGDGPPRTLTLLRGRDAEGAPAWYARSDHLRRVVRLGDAAADVAADAEAVVGLTAPG